MEEVEKHEDNINNIKWEIFDDVPINGRKTSDAMSLPLSLTE